MTSADAFAQAVSIVLSPLLMPAYVVLLVLLDVGASVSEITAALASVLVLLCLVPLADMLWMIRRGKTVSIDVPNRDARTEVLAVAIVGASAALLLIRSFGFHGEPLVHTILVAFIVNLIVTIGINFFWKISVHMIAFSGSIAILLIVADLTGENSAILRQTTTVLPLFFLLLMVGWARSRLRVHSVVQIVVGAILGFGGHWLATFVQVSGMY